jgi:hypothetical protein
MPMGKLGVFVACLVLPAGLVGCGNVKQAADRSRAMNAVKALSIDYFDYQKATGHPPASAADLNGFLQNRGEKPALEAGELERLTVQWGARLDPAAPDGGTRVLASHPAVGGQVPVLMQDGSVKTLTEAELAAAPKAQPVKKPE